MREVAGGGAPGGVLHSTFLSWRRLFPFGTGAMGPGQRCDTLTGEPVVHAAGTGMGDPPPDAPTVLQASGLLHSEAERLSRDHPQCHIQGVQIDSALRGSPIFIQ